MNCYNDTGVIKMLSCCTLFTKQNKVHSDNIMTSVQDVDDSVGIDQAYINKPSMVTKLGQDELYQVANIVLKTDVASFINFASCNALLYSVVKNNFVEAKPNYDLTEFISIYCKNVLIRSQNQILFSTINLAISINPNEIIKNLKAKLHLYTISTTELKYSLTFESSSLTKCSAQNFLKHTMAPHTWTFNSNDFCNFASIKTPISSDITLLYLLSWPDNPDNVNECTLTISMQYPRFVNDSINTVDLIIQSIIKSLGLSDIAFDFQVTMNEKLSQSNSKVFRSIQQSFNNMSKKFVSKLEVHSV